MAVKPKTTKARAVAKPKANPRKKKPTAANRKAEAKAREEKGLRAFVRRSREVEDEILSRIIGGETVRQMCRSKHLPDAVTWYGWLAKDGDLQARYEAAKEAQVEAEIDQIRDLADRPLDMRDDGTTIEGMSQEKRREELQRRRMQIDARQWRIPKLSPKKYGQKSTVVINHHEDIQELSDDDLRRAIMRKMEQIQRTVVPVDANISKEESP